MIKRPRVHDADHLAFVRQLPCIVCGDDVSVEACHVRYGDPHAGKPSTGMAEKPSDRWTVPLCGRHHRSQHQRSERGWWEAKDINPIVVAQALYIAHGDHETAAMICNATVGGRAAATSD
jgi:hypothetical protein